MGVDQDKTKLGPKGLRDHFKAQEGYPGNLRRMLIQAIARQRAAVDLVRDASFLTPDLALGFAGNVLHEALTMLFGSLGLAFRGDRDVAQVFERELGSSKHFRREDIQLYFQLQELQQQAQHAVRFADPEALSTAWEEPLNGVVSFLERFEQYVLETFTSARQRARRKLIRRVALGGGAALLLAGLVWGYIATRPRSANVDPSRITKPGGIVGVYYNGKSFDRRVLRRVDRQINLNSVRSPARGIQPDLFSVRWQGYLYIPKTGSSYLCVVSDDGGRVYLNQRLLINDWTVHPRHKACKKVRLKKGWFPLKVEFFELTGGAKMQLLWGTRKKRVRTVPPKHLCCQD